MTNNISLHTLIEQGNEIKKGISYIPPGKGIRTFKVYKLANNQAYADWKALVNLYMQQNQPVNNAQEVKGLFEEFERYWHRPETLEQILGILKALVTLNCPTNSDVANNGFDSCSRKIFVVHGHDEEYINKIARFLEKLNCEPIILKEQPNSGKTIIEKFKDLSKVSFAVVLYTACDRGGTNDEDAELRPRARQNVIFEHGYLLSQLGQERVCALVEKGVEIPSDQSGILYVPIDKNDAWKFQLAREMKSVGIDIDLNRTI